jgi:hypothetical protein
MGIIEQLRQNHKDDSDFDLFVLKEQMPPITPEHKVALALLHEKAVNREMKKFEQAERIHRNTQRVAWTAVVVAVVGILVAASGVTAHIWTYLHPVTISSPTTGVQAAQPTPLPPQTISLSPTKP